MEAWEKASPLLISSVYVINQQPLPLVNMDVLQQEKAVLCKIMTPTNADVPMEIQAMIDNFNKVINFL